MVVVRIGGHCLDASLAVINTGAGTHHHTTALP